MRPSTGLAIIGGVLAVVSGVEVLTRGPLTKLDIKVAVNYAPITHSASTDFAHLLQQVGKPWIACLVLGALAVAFSVIRRRPGPALAAVIGLGIVGVTTWLLKEVFPHKSVVGKLDGSFPSGHTGVAVVLAGLLLQFVLPRRPWRTAVSLLVAALWGAIMAWGRLVIEAHWLSDVIAGWGIGMVALVVALRTAEQADRVGYRST